MEIKIAEQLDLKQILELQYRAFYGQALIYNDFKLPPLTQTLDEISKEFTHKTIYKLEMDGKIVASIRCAIENEILLVERLIVDPKYQNQGIGTSIMKEIENLYSNTVKKYTLFTGHKSERNIRLYEKLGYKEIRQEPLTNNCMLVYMEKRNDLTIKKT
ncbi:MAG: GNAT family N-acetyltransferase [Rubrobacteridae bacterium]|nr:GNAT family N-acetyltransferase [Rubrobacteridae bacterium]